MSTLDVLYTVTARAMVWRRTYDGPMTEEGWREVMRNNPELFWIEWGVEKVTTENGAIVAASHKED